MNREDYTKYSAKPATEEIVDFSDISVEYEAEENVEKTEVNPEPTPETVITSVAAPEPEPEPKVKTQTGIVANCKKLRVREKPYADAPVILVIDEGTQLEIVPSESTVEFYKVYTEFGASGYCVKKFIQIKSK